MNMPMKTTGNGLTGFWVRVGKELNVRIVNGTMYKLLNARKGFTLTHILSPHLSHQIVRARQHVNMYPVSEEVGDWWRGSHYGLYGLKTSLSVPGWVSSTKSRKLKAQRAQAAMSQSISSNPPFSRLIGLKDGSASDTAKAFQMRRNGKPMP